MEDQSKKSQEHSKGKGRLFGFDMTEGRLRSIEGLGVPLLVVVSIIIAAFVISQGLTRYQVQTDQRILALEKSAKRGEQDRQRLFTAIQGLATRMEQNSAEVSKSVNRLVLNLRKDVNNTTASAQSFDRAGCQEVMLALKVRNPTITTVDCYQLPSAQRHGRPIINGTWETKTGE